MGAAADRGVPLTLLDVTARYAQSPYTHALLLSRPDAHVAWRGDRIPPDPLALIDLVRGPSARF